MFDSNSTICIIVLMKLDDYLKLRKITVIQASSQLGITRARLYQIFKGSPTSRKLSQRIETWTNGAVNRYELLFPGEND